MQNRRHKTNPAKQNEDLYEIFLIDKRREKAWNWPADYYILSAAYKREGFVLSTKRLCAAMHTGIIIVDESVRTIIENIDWNKYAVKNIGTFNLSPAQIHKAYNEAVSK